MMSLMSHARHASADTRPPCQPSRSTQPPRWRIQIGMSVVSEIRARHRAELAELEEVAKQMVRNATKKERSSAQARANQMLEDLAYRHMKELEDFDSDDGDDAGLLINAAAEEASRKLERLRLEEKLRKKRDKDRQKKENKARRESEAAAKKDYDRANTVGKRDVEMAAIMRKLAPYSLTIKEIMADGSCLYRSIADQLALLGHPPEDHVSLRLLASRHIRERKDEFCPFLVIEAVEGDADAFSLYCDRIRDDSSAWGGQPELRALAAALQCRIEVWSADAPTVIMGEDYCSDVSSSGIIKLSFHKHYYALGEHYNSIVPN